jgi:WD40 repeat protein
MGELADKLAAKSPAFQRAYLGSLPQNLVKSRNLGKYYQTLTDFDFLAAKINHSQFSVQALIEDYDLIDEAEISTEKECNPEQVKTLKLIQGALRLSAHILNKYKKQLAAQLWGRLLCFEAQEIQDFLNIVKRLQFQPWLRPVLPSLEPPGRLIRTLTGHSSSVDAVAITSSGKQLLISGSNDKTIKVWNLEAGSEGFTFRGHTDQVTYVAVTPSGQKLISASKDKTIKVWSLTTGVELNTLIGHTEKVNALAFMPDERLIISGSCDSSLKVWHIETGEELYTFTGHTGSVQAIAVTPNGKYAIGCIPILQKYRNAIANG